MVIFDGLKLIGFLVMLILFIICIVINVIDRIIYTLKKRKQKGGNLK